MIDDVDADDATNPYAGPVGLQDEPQRWSRRASITFVVLASLGLWAGIWYGVNAFVQSLAPGY